MECCWILAKAPRWLASPTLYQVELLDDETTQLDPRVDRSLYMLLAQPTRHNSLNNWMWQLWLFDILESCGTKRTPHINESTHEDWIHQTLEIQSPFYEVWWKCNFEGVGWRELGLQWWLQRGRREEEVMIQGNETLKLWDEWYKVWLRCGWSWWLR